MKESAKEMKKKTESKKWKKVIGVIVFLLILAFIVLGIQRVLDLSYSKRYEVWTDYCDEEKGTVDAVFVGASNVYNFWIAPTCWEEYGYTIFPLALPSMHVDFIPYVIEEARKTNPDVPYIICLNSLKSAEKMDVSRLHNTVDYMPLSDNKVAMIDAMTEQMGIEGLDKLEFYMPLIRFHDRWAELKAEDFDLSTDELKAASTHRLFKEKRVNVTKEYVTTEKRVALNEKQEASLTALLDYCDEKQVNALFVINPQPLKKEKVAGQFNTIEDTIRERGYPVFNMLDKTEEMDLCQATDFYDRLHTNVHGALKYTRYLSEYIKEHYGFEDKRGKAGYESWDNAVEKYRKIIGPYLLDFETEDAQRYQSKPVRIKSSTETEDGVTVTWNRIGDAEEYAVYRRQNEENWELLAYTDAGTDTYKDTTAAEGNTYLYAAVPVKTDMTGKSYGNFVISKAIALGENQLKAAA